MGIKVMFFAILLVLFVTSAVYVKRLHAEDNYVMQCDKGLCIVSQAVMERLLEIIEHWKGQAKTCRSV